MSVGDRSGVVDLIANVKSSKIPILIKVQGAIRNSGGSKASVFEGVEASIIYVRFKVAASEDREVISAFMLVAILIIPIGVATLFASRDVVEIVDSYETHGIPAANQSA